MESDPATKIEGYDFGKQKSVDSDSFREPIDPRTLDPFGEIHPQSDDSGQGDGSIPEKHFEKSPETDEESPAESQINSFRAPTILGNPPESGREGRSVSEPFGEKLFQTPRIEDLTTMKQKNGKAPLNR